MTDGSTQQQGGLPFAEGEAARADRRNDLMLAVDRIDGGRSLHLMHFALFVFDASERGQPLVASYVQLAGPRMLRCSESTARRIVAIAKESGLIWSEECFDGAQQRSNAYYLFGTKRPPGEGGHTEHPGVHTEHPGVQGEQALPDTPREFAAPPLREPGGETPHARAARAFTSIRSLDQSSSSSTTDDDADFWQQVEQKRRLLRNTLWKESDWWPGDPRDLRLLARLAVLRLVPEHAGWIAALVMATAETRAKKPLAYLQSILADHAPVGVDPRRLFNSITVPDWLMERPRSKEPQEPP